MKRIERVQTGIRIEKRILKVLKAVAAEREMALGELVEGIVLHALEGKPAFSRASLRQIAELRAVFKLELTAADSHKLVER